MQQKLEELNFELEQIKRNPNPQIQIAAIVEAIIIHNNLTKVTYEIFADQIEVNTNVNKSLGNINEQIKNFTNTVSRLINKL